MKQLLAGLLGGVASVAALASAPTASAQGASHPVVQAIPGEDNRKLTAALARLGRDSRDLAALIDAGDAARALQDYDAAIGFYRRAEEVSASNARVKAGLGSAFVLKGDPLSALPHFDAAERAGGTPALMAADRGLAYDLLGDNASAQKYYTQALSAVPSAQADEVRSRLAVSQAIAGNADAAYKTLLPLLNKQDKPGWRTRAFTLAIAGETSEAVDVAGKILPSPLAANIAPYLRYMPRLTPAQQAAAANLGRFPKASEIGRDDPRIAAYTPPATVGAGGALVPKGAPLGRPLATTTAAARTAATTRRTRSARSAATGGRQRTGANATRAAQVAAADPERVAPPEPKPAIERATGELPPLARSTPAPSTAATMVAALAPVQATTASTATLAPTPTAAPGLWGAAAPSSSAVPLSGAGQPTPAAPPRLSLPPVTQAPSPTPGATPRVTLPQVVQGASAPSGTGTTSSAPALAAAAPAPAPAPAPARTASPIAAASAPSGPPPGPGQLSLSDIFADLGRPTVEALPVSGAVDMRLITPAAPPPPPRVQLPTPEDMKPIEARTKAAEPEAKAEPRSRTAKASEAPAKGKAKADAAKKKPAHPSRTWVQIGVGRDKAAIAFDWRRNVREYGFLFKSREPYVSDMGHTNRVVVGPFASRTAANAFIADARKQGFTNVLPWVSEDGEAVEPLAAK
ncbi:SPOR domain-containing protein [Novosphingobium panipatense]|uniref:SPOR domain-containing protein n=1 Tax=Novosphingobium TaxID=165696 RepID=UPI000CDA8AF1|nr:SPOR domain-containing protein [Novosphingobium sp. HII-3]